MRDKKTLTAFLFILVLIFPCIGYAGPLTRPQAFKLILNYEKFPATKTKAFFIATPDDFEQESEQGDFARALKALGYIDSANKVTLKSEEAKKGKWIKKSRSTPAGNYDRYDIPLGNRDLIAVTGLSKLQGRTGSVVHATFTWRWKPVSDVGTEMKLDKKAIHGGAIFQKFDDGWRIYSISFEGELLYAP